MMENQKSQTDTAGADSRRSSPAIGSAEFDARLGVPDHLAGVYAESQLAAEGILEFASPTRGADGKWYRCTIALSNVPVLDLYQALSTVDLVARRLREEGAVRRAEELEAVYGRLKRLDHSFPQNTESENQRGTLNKRCAR